MVVSNGPTAVAHEDVVPDRIPAAVVLRSAVDDENATPVVCGVVDHGVVFDADSLEPRPGEPATLDQEKHSGAASVHHVVVDGHVGRLKVLRVAGGFDPERDAALIDRVV